MRDRKRLTNIPSQLPAQYRAGSDAYDIQTNEPLKRKSLENYPYGTLNTLVPNATAQNSVLSTFDSRPVNCTDFLKAFVIAGNIFNAGRSVSVSLTNVNGKISILRSWNINAIFSAVAPDVIVNPDGSSNVLVRIGFKINDVDVPEYSDNEFNSLPFGTLGADAFILIGQEDVLTFTADIDPLTPPSIVFVDGEIQLYGNSLLSSGRQLNLEPATQFPINVAVK